MQRQATGRAYTQAEEAGHRGIFATGCDGQKCWHGGDQFLLARNEPLEQTAVDGEAASAPGIEGGEGARPGSVGGGAQELLGEAMAAKKKAARKKSTPKKAARKRPTAKKAAPKRAASKTRPTKRPAKKPAAKKVTARKTAAKKPAAKRPATARQDWVVTASADRPMAEIAKELSAVGFAIEQSLDQMGVFTGKSDDGAAKKVRGIRGVTNVSPIPPAHVGPPGSDETW